MTEINQVEDCKTFWKRSVGEIITYSEGSLMDIIQRGRNDINFLITTIESLQAENNQYETTVTRQQEAFKDQGREILQHRRELESQKEEIEKWKVSAEIYKDQDRWKANFEKVYADREIEIGKHAGTKIDLELAIKALEEIEFLISQSECSPYFYEDSAVILKTVFAEIRRNTNA